MDRKLAGDVNWFAEFQSTCSLSGRHATEQQPVCQKSYKCSEAFSPNLLSPDIYSENIQWKFFSQAVLLNNVIVKSFPTLYTLLSQCSCMTQITSSSCVGCPNPGLFCLLSPWHGGGEDPSLSLMVKLISEAEPSTQWSLTVVETSLPGCDSRITRQVWLWKKNTKSC